MSERTERPVTVEMGTNILVGRDANKLAPELSKILEGDAKQGTTPPLWDGRGGRKNRCYCEKYVVCCNQLQDDCFGDPPFHKLHNLVTFKKQWSRSAQVTLSWRPVTIVLPDSSARRSRHGSAIV